MRNRPTIRPPTAPKHLSEEARTRWRVFVTEYGIDDAAGLLIVQTAMEALDEMRAGQAEIERDGATVTDRFGQQKPHPAVTRVRDARGQMLAALKALNLDLEPLRDRPGRPAGR